MEDKWINKFQTKLDGFQMNEPEGLWEDIEKALDEKPMPISAGKRASTVPLWIRITAPVAAAAVLLLLVMMQMQYGEKTDDFNRLAVVKEESMQKSEIKSEESNTSAMPEPAKEVVQLAAGAARKMLALAQTPHRAEAPVAEVSVAETPVAEKSVAEKSVVDEKRAAEVSSSESAVAEAVAEKPRSRQENLENRTRKENQLRSSLLAKAHKPSGVSVDLFASNVSIDLGRVGDSSVMQDSSDPLFSSEPIPFGEFVQFKNHKPKIEMEHRQPVRYGVSFKYGLSDRLSLGSGLVYSRHSSSVYSVLMTRTHVAEQHLHYLGVPLNLDYRIWNYRNFSLYTSAGVMAEKCVSGESVDIYSDESTSVKEKAFQFSVNGAVGAQYSLSRHVGVYVEPGVNYYIDNGSSIDNIYKDKPLNFNLEVGLRITFK